MRKRRKMLTQRWRCGRRPGWWKARPAVLQTPYLSSTIQSIIRASSCMRTHGLPLFLSHFTCHEQYFYLTPVSLLHTHTHARKTNQLHKNISTGPHNNVPFGQRVCSACHVNHSFTVETPFNRIQERLTQAHTLSHTHTHTHTRWAAHWFTILFKPIFTQCKTSVLTLDVLNRQIMPLNVSVEISQFGETLIKDCRTQPTYTHTKPHEPSWIYFSLLKKYHIRTYFKSMKIRSAAVPVSVWFKQKKTDSWRQVKSFVWKSWSHVHMDANVMRRFRGGKWQRAPRCSTHDFVILSLYI